MKLFLSAVASLFMAQTAFSNEITLNCKIDYTSQRNSISKLEDYVLQTTEIKKLKFGTYTLELRAGDVIRMIGEEDITPITVSLWSPKHKGYVVTASSFSVDESASVGFRDTKTLEGLNASCKIAQ